PEPPPDPALAPALISQSTKAIPAPVPALPFTGIPLSLFVILLPLYRVGNRPLIAAQRRDVVTNPVSRDPFVVAAVEGRGQAKMRRPGALPEFGVPGPVGFAARAHRDPDLDPDLAGIAAGLLRQPAQLAEHVSRALVGRIGVR